ncbi:hypothetical protein GCM10022392_31350 [Mucilaginibacter panaciglaebae]|uniref:Uncharacterized protein n=1 Tax=Mucilaginibacter panaciglaebae TaxID=502331 RepID=A0ABP7X4D1_9SPHI
MVSFLPVTGNGGRSDWALTLPIRQQNTIKSPNNFINLPITKLVQFFFAFQYNMQFNYLLPVIIYVDIAL